MSRNSPHWAPTEGLPESKCIKCKKPTTSHAVFLEDDGEDFVPSTEEDADFLFPVCHTCYAKWAGRAEAFAEHMNTKRSDILELGGVTPKDIGRALDTDNIEHTERTKAMGEGTVEQFFRRIEPGDVISPNDDGEWVVLPVEPDEFDDTDVDVKHGMVELSTGGRGGALVRSSDVKSEPYYYYLEEDTEEVCFDRIQSLELLGRNEEVLDGA